MYKLSRKELRNVCGYYGAEVISNEIKVDYRMVNSTIEVHEHNYDKNNKQIVQRIQ